MDYDDSKLTPDEKQVVRDEKRAESRHQLDTKQQDSSIKTDEMSVARPSMWDDEGEPWPYSRSDTHSEPLPAKVSLWDRFMVFIGWWD